MSIPLVASLSLPVADELITPEQLLTHAAHHAHLTSSATPLLPPSKPLLGFQEVDLETNLNETPGNWLVPSSTPGVHDVALSALSVGVTGGRAGELAASELAAFDADADVLAPTLNMKKIFKMTYSDDPVSLAVHRVGSTLVVDGAIDPFQIPSDGPHQEGGGGYGRPVPPKKPRSAFSERLLYSKFLYHHHQSQGVSGVSGVGGGQQGRRDQTHVPYLEDPATPLPGSSKFTKTFAFKLKDQKLILGSDLLVFSTADHPSISLRLHSIEEEISQSTSLDYWLDNVLADVPEVCICYHKGGYVQGYQIVPTADIPSLSKPPFSPAVVEETASSVLQFLKDNATRDGGTYWVYKGKGENTLQLYDLSNPRASSPPPPPSSTSTSTSTSPPSSSSSGSSGPETPFAFAVAMLCYRLGFKLMESARASSTTGSKGVEHGVESYGDRILRARSLFERSLDMLNPRTRPGVSISVTRKLAETYISEFRPGLPLARVMQKTAVNGDPRGSNGGGIPGGSNGSEMEGADQALVAREVFDDALEVESYVSAGKYLMSAAKDLVSYEMCGGRQACAQALINVPRLWVEIMTQLAEVQLYLAYSAIRHRSGPSGFRHLLQALIASSLVELPLGGERDRQAQDESAVGRAVKALAIQALGDIVLMGADDTDSASRLREHARDMLDSLLDPMSVTSSTPLLTHPSSSASSHSDFLLDILDADDAKVLERVAIAGEIGLFGTPLADAVSEVHASVASIVSSSVDALDSVGDGAERVALYSLMLRTARVGSAVLGMSNVFDHVRAEFDLRVGAVLNMIGSEYLEKHQFTKALQAFAEAEGALDNLPVSPRVLMNQARVAANVGRAYRLQAMVLGNSGLLSGPEEELHAEAAGAYLRASKILALRKVTQRTELFADINRSLGGTYLALSLRLIEVAPAFASSPEEALSHIHKRLKNALHAYTLANAADRVALVHVQIARVFALAIQHWNVDNIVLKVKLVARLFSRALDAATASGSHSLLLWIRTMQIELHLADIPGTRRALGSPSAAALNGVRVMARHGHEMDPESMDSFVEFLRKWLKSLLLQHQGEGDLRSRVKEAYRLALVLGRGGEVGFVEGVRGLEVSIAELF